MICILDYGMGNLFSIANALKALNAEFSITSDPNSLKRAKALILPGVGNFGEGARNLKKMKLLEPVLSFIDSGMPTLGICLGMQLLMEASDEAPGEQGLSIFKGNVIKFPTSSGYKIPQIGWNSVNFLQPNPLIENIPNNSYFYFVHSYFVNPEDHSIILGRTDYITKFPSIIAKNNIFATQFHPEKSQKVGLQLLSNFIKLTQTKT